MDPLMDVINNSQEPEWLEKRFVGELRVWHIIFLSMAGVTSLTLELLHEKTKLNMADRRQESQRSSIVSPQQSSFDASFQPDGQKAEPQAGMSFVKFASKVATLSKLGQPKTPSPTQSNNKMDF